MRVSYPRLASRALLGVALLLSVALAACDSVDSGPDYPGVYQLRSVNDEVVPVLLLGSGSDGIFVQSGSMTMREDLTYSVTVTLRFAEGNDFRDIPDTSNGTFTETGENRFSLLGPEEDRATAVLVDDELTVTFEEDDTVWVFRR